MSSPSRSPLTNGLLVSVVGRWRISDKAINFACACFVPYLVWSLVKARWWMKGGWRDVLFQVFSLGHNVHKDLVYKVDAATATATITAVKEVTSSVIAEGKNSTCLRFVCISDTHNLHYNLGPLPVGDVLVCTGDFTNHGSIEEVRDFADWLRKQPFRIKLVVPGNHDLIFDTRYYDEYWSDWSIVKQSCQLAFDSIASIPGTHLLIDRTIVLDGKVKVHGSPWIPQRTSWKTGFNKKVDELAGFWDSSLPKTEEGVHVLLTHSPPFGTRDRETAGHHVGCEHLKAAVVKMKPLVHVFGHIHSEYGVTLHRDADEQRFKEDESVANSSTFPVLSINASSVSDYYLVGDRKPITFDIIIS